MWVSREVRCATVGDETTLEGVGNLFERIRSGAVRRCGISSVMRASGGVCL